MIELRVDGKEIPMNDFVKNVFEKVVTSLVSTLKGVDENWKELNIVIKR